MNRLYIILSILLAVFGIIFTILPMGTIALIPITLALIAAFMAFLRQRNKVFPKIILGIVVVNLLTVLGKEVFIKDVVQTDKQFESVKQDSEKQAQKELEELENLP